MKIEPHACPSAIAHHACGFTLIEMIVSIVITSIVVGMVTLFIKQPIQSYFDVAHRAEITDAADTAVRRMSRDLHLVLPNSIRHPSDQCLEFLPTKTGGRYRTDLPGIPLDFTAPATSFDYLGTLSSMPVATDRVVIYNLGIEGADAYTGINVGTVVSDVTGNNIVITPPPLGFPFRSPGSRFHVVPDGGASVSYVCNNTGAGLDANGDGQGRLYRLVTSNPAASTPSACPATPVGTPEMARNVSSCTFTYAPGITARTGLVSMRIAITKGKETATIYHEVHVNNAP